MVERMNGSSEIYVPCPHCQGTGKVKHFCNEYSLQQLKLIWESRYTPWYYESLGIYRCSVCGQLWKIRRQWDYGGGSDDIWVNYLLLK